MKIALIGAGQRGMIYARNAVYKGNEIIAVAELNEEKRAIAQKEFSIPREHCYADAMTLLAKPKMADAVFIATMDRDHYSQTMTALKQGYDILLEKPISPDPKECMKIADFARQCGRSVVICHVLRYSPFFQEIKKIIDSGEIGKVISIQHNENIGNFHMAHAFVRGNWRRSDQTSPIIVQKSCHDLDLLVWFANSKGRSISSFGSLSYFTSANAPNGAAKRCMDCPHKETCRFSAYRCYLPVAGRWPATALTVDQSPEGLDQAIAHGPYGQCVYHCDNTVCDHQVTIIEFENGITATFHMSGFTNQVGRTTKIMCEHGEIRASDMDNSIEVIPFKSSPGEMTRLRKIQPNASYEDHGGGDWRIVNRFMDHVKDKSSTHITDIYESVESHVLAHAAEMSRLENRTVDVMQYRSGLL